MKVYKKILLVLLLIMFFISNISNAVDTSYYKPSDLTSSDTSEIADMAGVVLGVIRAIGITISVVILAVIGLKYMCGSLEEKANYKENMIPYIAGCFLLASATTIPSIVYELVR